MVSRLHAQLGAEKTRQLLKDELMDDELNEVCRIIELHDQRVLTEETIYIKI